MPTYVFYNNDTAEYFEEFMSIASREEFLKNNPNVSAVVTAPNIVSGVSTGSVRTDNGFKEVLSKVAEAHPNSAVGQQYGKRDTKAAKTAEIAKKHGF